MPTPDINAILALPANDVSSRYGAPMGRRKQVEGEPRRLYLQRIRFVDFDYDTGGAYWGGYQSMPLWCAFSADGDTRVFVRARNRKEAAVTVLEELPDDGWSFHKSPA